MTVPSLLGGVHGYSYSVDLPPKWDPGDGWGYKWDLDMNDIANAINEESSNYPYGSLSVSGNGRILSVLYIEYEGKDSGGYRFMYEGRTYTKDSTMNMHMDLENSYYSYSSINMDMKLHINKIDVKFDGHFWLKGFRSYGSEYYGITKQTIDDLHYIVDMKGSMHGSSYDEYNGRQTYSGDITYNYDLTTSDFEISYSPAIPYLPYDTDTYEDISVNDVYVTYRGHVTGNYAYDIDITGGDTYRNYNPSDSGRIDTYLHSTEQVSNIELNYNPNTGISEKPAIFTGAGSMVFPNPSSNQKVSFNPYIIEAANKGKLSGNFYEAMTAYSLDLPSTGDRWSSSLPNLKDNSAWSTPISKGEVEGIRTSDDPFSSFPFWVILIVAIVSIVVVLPIILIHNNKRKRSIAPIQFQPQYPQYQYHQYPEMSPPPHNPYEPVYRPPSPHNAPEEYKEDDEKYFF